MTEDKRQALGRFLGKNKFALLVLFVGLVLILLPKIGGESQINVTAEAVTAGGEERLAAALYRMEGTGEVCVLLAQDTDGKYTGAVVVCEGAGDAGVRLRIYEAVSVFTGLGSDRITVLKMKS